MESTGMPYWAVVGYVSRYGIDANPDEVSANTWLDIRVVEEILDDLRAELSEGVVPKKVVRDGIVITKGEVANWIGFYADKIQQYTGRKRFFSLSKDVVDQYRKVRHGRGYSKEEMEMLADEAARDPWWNGSYGERKDGAASPLQVIRAKTAQVLIEKARERISRNVAVNSPVVVTAKNKSSMPNLLSQSRELMQRGV